ncbi:hypothetical protein ACFY8W_11965 [Streptomyces sp. NPDC012637]|uniref:hypothetical protein n=1 Tax=Streptomyces sp. NPDC012637 TaxID=3364842 RepID=UPI0036E0D741
MAWFRVGESDEAHAFRELPDAGRRGRPAWAVRNRRERGDVPPEVRKIDSDGGPT